MRVRTAVLILRHVVAAAELPLKPTGERRQAGEPEQLNRLSERRRSPGALMFSLCPKGLGGGTAGGAWIARTRSVGSGGAGRLRRRYRIKPQVLSNPGIRQAGGRKSAKRDEV